MTLALIERFKPLLEPFEKERLKIVHDRRAYLFIAWLVGFLAFLLLLAGLFGPSGLVVIFSLVMFAACGGLLVFRASLGSSMRIRFRETFIREWFHAAYPGVFLSAPPKEIPLEVSRSLREACIRATAQTPSRTRIEERILFDTDTYHSWTFILAERSFWGGIKSRAIVWFRAGSDDTPFVAFVWPSVGISRAPDLRFFMNGKPIEAGEPLRSKLLSVYDRLRAKAGGLAVRVSVSPTGVWAGVKLKASLFEVPPVTKSFLDVASYDAWTDEARLPVDREIASLLASL